MAMTEKDVLEKSKELQKFWQPRNKKMGDWYKILRLEDNLADKNKESYVSNDPRTFYNLSKHLLTPNVIPHRFPIEGLDTSQKEATQLLENDFAAIWSKLEKGYQRSGKQSWIGRLVGHILSYGWYAVQVSTDAEDFYADIWNPTQVFQSFSPDPEIGLVECVHMYKMQYKAALKKAKLQGWPMPTSRNMDVWVFDYWFIDDNGDVAHAIVADGKFVVAPFVDTRFEHIPVVTGPVGGLPDEGELDRKWQQHHGESIVAVNEEIYKNSDRLASFLQQATREATEPKWLELSAGGQILQPENFYSGAIFRGEPTDAVVALQPPPIPVELIQRIFSYDQDKQKASFSPLMYGNIQFQVAAYTLSQMAQAAQQVLRPYHEATKTVLSRIDNMWLKEIKENRTSVNVPTGFPEDTEVEVEYPISIPGDLLNRITAAKMISPELHFDQETALEMFFPEIKDPRDIIAKARKDKAINSPVGIAVSEIRAYRAMAVDARKRDDEETAKLYEKAEDAVMSMLSGAPPEEAAPEPTVKPPPMTPNTGTGGGNANQV